MSEMNDKGGVVKPPTHPAWNLLTLLFIVLGLWWLFGSSSKNAVPADPTLARAEQLCEQAMKERWSSITHVPKVKNFGRYPEYYFAWAGDNAMQTPTGNISGSCILNKDKGVAQLTLFAKDVPDFKFSPF
jgi:hypothetical protein